MKTYWLLLALLPGTSLHALQGTTPQAALEELATATEPETIARHLPEPVQQKLNHLPNEEKQQMIKKLMEIKDDQLGGYTARPAQGSEGWELIDANGNVCGSVKVADVFFSGVNALLPVEIRLDQGNAQVFLVTMHLEDDEWRLDDFGPWSRNDLNLAKLLHQPTEMEKNEASAVETLKTIRQGLQQYAYQEDILSYPGSLKVLTEAKDDDESILDASFAVDPYTKDGYEFRYVRTSIGSGDTRNVGTYEILAAPIEFNKTGSKNYFCNQFGIHVTDENRPAASSDPTAGNEVQIVD